MPVWKKVRMAGLDSLAAMGMVLGSVKCSPSLKASPPAACFSYLIAVLANTKRTIKVHYVFHCC